MCIRDRLKTFPEEIQKQKTRIAALQQDSQIAAAHPQDKENFWDVYKRQTVRCK